jgi:flagellar FliJ protein
MARFVFRLDNYLGVKEKLEEQKKNEYSQALRRLEDERQRKAKLVAELDEHVAGFKKSLESRIDPVYIKRCNNRIEFLKVRIAEQTRRVEKAEKQAEAKRLELVEAMKQRKMLEKVKENSYEEFQIGERRAEQRAADEIISYNVAASK